jgi:hypothetical protein
MLEITIQNDSFVLLYQNNARIEQIVLSKNFVDKILMELKLLISDSHEKQI